jgi:hypothetical protein
VASECVENHLDADCSSAGWSISHTMLNCGYPYGCTGNCAMCPSAPPEAGSACQGPYDQDPCSYAVDTPCGAVTETATCAGGVWTLAAPTCPGCSANATSDVCLADPGCRWIAPGCDPMPAPLGCFPKDDCVVGAPCGNGGSCAAYGADPCWAGDCNQCAAPVDLCVNGPG